MTVVLVAVWGWNAFDTDRFYVVNARWPREGDPIFASHFATWDAAHYLYLSEVGYNVGVHSCAFYPLWPLMIRGFSIVTGGSHLIAGLVLSNLFSLAAFVVFFRLVAERLGESTAKLALLLLLTYPGALFYQFIYTESLFFLLLMLLWLGLERRRHGLAFAAAALLPLTRAIGLFCVLPILWHLLVTSPPKAVIRLTNRFSWLRKLGFAGVNSGTDTEPQLSQKAWWLLAAPVAGWACYLALMWHWTSNPFEGFDAQKHWRVHSISNLWNVPKFVIGLFNPTQWHAFSGSLLDRCVFIMLVYCLPLLWRLDKGWFIWAWVLGVVPAMSGTFTSLTRFAAVAFPMFIAMAVFLGRNDLRWLRYATVAGFGVLHIVLVWRFVNFRWAG